MINEKAFHIICNADENYIKYAAVLITSIVKNTNPKDKATCFTGSNKYLEGYHFHILTDTISEKNQHKLKVLQKELNTLYPCVIQIHQVSNEGLENNPLFGREASQNLLAFYRIKMMHFIPQNLDKCLYIDVDMLVLSDIRTLWSMDIQNKIIGAVFHGYRYASLQHKRTQHTMKTKHPELFFNSGLMIINVAEWKKNQVEENCLKLMKDYNNKGGADQTFLNLAIADKVYKLPYSWNIFLYDLVTEEYENARCKDESEEYHINYTRKEYEKALKYPDSIHYIGYAKPWLSLYNHFDRYYTPAFLKHKNIFEYYCNIWWDMAFKTPIFDKELKELKSILSLSTQQLQVYALNLGGKLRGLEERIQRLETTQFGYSNDAVYRLTNRLSYKIGNLLVLKSKTFLGILSLPFSIGTLIYNFIKTKKKYKVMRANFNYYRRLAPLKKCENYAQSLKIERQLSYQIGQALIQAHKTWYKGGYILLPFKIYKINKKKHK